MKPSYKDNIHRPRTNKYGVTWCTECGLLFTKPNKPLDKNFTINKPQTTIQI